MNRYPRYPAYKASGVEWLGKIPAHWEVRRIKYSTYLKARVGWHGLSVEERVQEGPYLVTGTDFDEGFINWKTCVHVSEERYEQDPYIQLHEGDLLITKDGTIGKVAMVRNMPDRATLNSGVFVTRPLDESYSTNFLYWTLNSDLFIHFIEFTKTGSTVNHLYQNTFSEFSFPIPTPEEQRAIVAFLDGQTAVLDALIAEKQALIGLLQEKRAAVIGTAVTQGLDPTVPMKDSGVEWIGRIPAHWEVIRLKHISPEQTVGIVVNPSNYVSDEGLPFLFGGDIQPGKILAAKARRISLEDSKKQYKSMLHAGDLVTIRVGYPGVTAVIPPELEGANCASIMIVRRSEKFVSDWLCYAMNSGMGMSQVEIVEYGAAQKQFNISHAVEFSYAVPPKEEQREIVKHLDMETGKVDQIIAETEASIAALQEYRAALIASAVTGQIDVRQVVKM